MDDMEEKLGAILNDPKMMQNIMAMAQSFQKGEPTPPCKEPAGPEIDLKMVKNLSRLAGQSRIEPREQALLRALGAYLSRERIQKLERAMKAARLAKLASGVLGPNLFQAGESHV